MKALFTVAGDQEAKKALTSKAVVSRKVFDAMLPEVRARLFTVGLIETMDGIQRVRDMIADVPMGEDWTKTRKALAQEFSPYFDDPEAANTRAELVLRTNAYDAYDASQARALNEQKDVLPYWQWNTAGDERVRDSHAALDGKVFPADSPFWERQKEWGCRCYRTALSEGDVQEMKVADADKDPGDRRVLEGQALRDAENGFLTVGPRTAADLDARRLEWGEKVGEPQSQVIDLNKGSRPRSTPLNDAGLRIDPQTLRGKYDAATWAIFENTARNVTLDGNTSLLDWLSGSPIQTGESGTSIVEESKGAHAKLASAVRAAGIDGKQDVLREDATRLMEEMREERPSIARDVIRNVKNLDPSGLLSESAVHEAVQGMLDYLPSTVVARAGKFSVEILPKLEKGIFGQWDGKRSTLLLSRELLSNDPAALKITCWHEMTHWVSDVSPEYRSAIRAHFQARVGNEEAQTTKDGLLVKKDRWLIPEAGRIYPGEGRGDGRELASTYMEILAMPPDVLAAAWSVPRHRETLEVVFSIFFRGPR